MNIAVCIKETFDTEARISIGKDGRIDCRQARLILNPYDEYAVEEAVHLKEKFGGRVIVITASASDPSKTVRSCLAMGADEGVIISDPLLVHADAHMTALALSRFLHEESCDLILCGREAVDDGASEVPSRLAELLDFPQAQIVSKLSLEGEVIKASRDLDGGTLNIRVALPCVVSVQKGINAPRYPSMRNILMAQKKKIRYLSFSDLRISSELSKPFVQVREITLPSERKAGKIFSGSVEEMVDGLVAIIRERTGICR